MKNTVIIKSKKHTNAFIVFKDRKYALFLPDYEGIEGACVFTELNAKRFLKYMNDPDLYIYSCDREKIESDEIILRPKRNDRCSCGSRKKYKNCCIIKA